MEDLPAACSPSFPSPLPISVPPHLLPPPRQSPENILGVSSAQTCQTASRPAGTCPAAPGPAGERSCCCCGAWVWLAVGAARSSCGARLNPVGSSLAVGGRGRPRWSILRGSGHATVPCERGLSQPARGTRDHVGMSCPGGGGGWTGEGNTGVGVKHRPVVGTDWTEEGSSGMNLVATKEPSWLWLALS